MILSGSFAGIATPVKARPIFFTQQKVDRVKNTNPNSESRFFKYAVMTWGAVASLFHIYMALVGYYETYVVIPLHVFLIVGLGFSITDWKGRRRSRFDRSFLLDIVLILALFVVTFNPIHDPFAFEMKYAAVDTTLFDKICGLTLIILVLELTRRVIGKGLLFFALLFIGYCVLGRHLPGVLKHQGFPLLMMAEYQYFSEFGIWSIVRIIATYVMLFIIFGSFIDRAKGGMFIQRLGNWLFGSAPGGPAKVAVVTSSMFGTISGSAVANVVTTGSFTIPMMKKVGYKPHIAGAVEAAASTGGQIMPPIMGAVAFVMADVLGIGYFTVCLAAAVPAILYYWALFTMIDMDARGKGIRGIPRDQLPKFREVFELAHTFIPVILLIGTLIAGFSVMRAGLVGIFSTILFAMIRKITRMRLATLWEGLYAAARTTIIASTACLTAGIIVGVIQQTGLGLRLSGHILSATHGYALIGLVLIMVISLMLGMGMPTVPSYVITVAVGATVLAKFGFIPIAAHMFILYYAVISCITPPIMVASYAAAAIAEADVWKVGFHAVKLAVVTYFIPFIFIYNPSLLLVAVPVSIANALVILISSLVGTFAIASSLVGFFFKHIRPWERILLIASGLLMIQPGWQTDLLGFGVFLALLAKNEPVRKFFLERTKNRRSPAI
jgi:TRAP transporter 4TM/12TM fusion protein